MDFQAAEHLYKETRERFIYLADQPSLIPQLAEWFYEEWGQGQAELTLEVLEGVLRERLNKNRLPLTLVLLKDSTPIASTSLKIREMETHPQYPHWLGSVYVLPKHRQRGIGSRLVQFSASAARHLGVEYLYLYTRSHEHFYTCLGWQPIERTFYRDRPAVIMKRNLSVE
jgi:predicted N-acetyltransferase YhbS